VLLEVLERRAHHRDPPAVLAQFERDGFTRPTAIDQRVLVELDGHLLAAAQGFEAIALSPLAPLGTGSAVGLASQNKIVSALRGTEVVSDPTNVLALESARLTARRRCAGRADRQSSWAPSIASSSTAMPLPIASSPCWPPRPRVALADRVAAAIGDRVAVSRQELTHPHYDGRASSSSSALPMANRPRSSTVAPFDWLRKLTANRRLTLVASGMGAQLVAYLFRRG